VMILILNLRCLLFHHWSREPILWMRRDSLVTCRECAVSWWERGPY
jgi:hypothetical protein